MPSFFVRCMLFVSSYFPLALIFSIFLFDRQRSWAVIILLVGLSGLIIMLLYLSVNCTQKGHSPREGG